MNTKHILVVPALLALLTLNPQLSTCFAQGTAFTYQGRVTDNGTNLSGAGQFKFALVTSTNFNHQATATATRSGQFITIINVTAGGSGYAGAPAVTISGGGGSGATAHATLTGDAVTGISVDNPGSGYTSTPSVIVAPPPPNVSYTTYWSNDGTSVAGSEPSAAVNVAVSNGLFTVVLGDTTVANMAAISASLFAQPNLQLRIWFNDGVHGSAALSPVQNLTPAPYAVQAMNANSASNLLGTLPVAQLNGTVENNQLANSSLTVNAGTGLSGGGTVALGGTTTLNNAGVTALTGGGGVTVSAANGAVTLDSTATSADTANAIVSRDASGNFSAGSVTLAGTLNLPGTPVTINSGGSSLLYVDANDNFFIGPEAGNLLTSGIYNTADGVNALLFNTSGSFNTANGFSALFLNTSGTYNTADGINALHDNTSGTYNTADGADTLPWNTTGIDNTAIGNAALYFNTTGSENTANGFDALLLNITGNDNTAVGVYALSNLGAVGSAGGTNNIAVGSEAGSAFTANESSDIDIGNVGVTGESGIIRIGTEGVQSDTFLVGNVGINVNNPGTASLSVQGGQTGVGNAFNFPVVLFQNTNSTVNNGPALRVVSGGGTNFYGALCVSANVVPGSGNGYIATFGNADNFVVQIGTDGTVYSKGVALTSDRNAKENFTAVNAQEVLAKVAALPVTEWNYKTDSKAVQHIGPMAQDFQAAFGLGGTDDKHISVVDEGGVELAAIQGLNQKLNVKDALIERQATEIAALNARLDKLERLINSKNGDAK